MRIQTYQEFWPYYLNEHSKPLTRKLHVVGMFVGLVIGIAATSFCWMGIFLWPAIGYAFAWSAHFFVEKNRPATWKYPLWSFVSEFRMTYLVLTGKL